MNKPNDRRSKLPQPELRFLIVDDDETSVVMLTKLLVKLGKVEALPSGDELVAKLTSARKDNAPFHAVFMDLMLPGRSGLELLKLIRKEDRSADDSTQVRTPVIVTSGRSDMSTILKCLDSGCDGYIAKPAGVESIQNELIRIGLIDGLHELRP